MGNGRGALGGGPLASGGECRVAKSKTWPGVGRRFPFAVDAQATPS